MRFCLHKQLSTPALATGLFIQSFCLHYAITYLIRNMKFHLGMDNSSDAVLKKNRVAKIVCRFARSGGHVDNCIIKTISSDAES